MANLQKEANKKTDFTLEMRPIYRLVCAKLLDCGPRRGFHSVWFQPSNRAKLVARDADFTPCNFSRRIARNWWLVMRISLHVISAVRSRVIGGIRAHDADSTPCDFSRPIARFNPNRPIARFNPDRPIARFNPDRSIAWFNPDRPIARFNPEKSK